MCTGQRDGDSENGEQISTGTDRMNHSLFPSLRTYHTQKPLEEFSNWVNLILFRTILCI